jgi:hypothetical protein
MPEISITTTGSSPTTHASFDRETSLSRLGILHAAEIKVIDSPSCLPIGLPLFRLDHLFHHIGHLCAHPSLGWRILFSGFNHLNTKMTEQDIYRRPAEAYAVLDQGQ